jgi:hypothetical protein
MAHLRSPSRRPYAWHAGAATFLGASVMASVVPLLGAVYSRARSRGMR